jgi:lysophospholipase L1-like esterase
MRPQFHRGWFATWCVLFFLGTRFPAPAQSNAARLKFQFGAGSAAPRNTLVAPEMIYTNELGFGFERGAELKANDHGGVASDKGFFFSAAVPEGNYRVTVTLGGSPVSSETTVNAELRRLMLERVRTGPGKTETRSFIVNVRRSAIAGGREVRLTPREKTSETWAWDDRLTLEFLGTHPAVVALEIEPVEVPTVFLIGDSTVCDQSREPYNSWGQMITRFFKPVVAVANHAESGESIAGALGKGRFDKIWSQIRKGDYLFVQFGHNDMKSTATNALEIYTADLRRIVDEARKRGATPVLCTSVSRRTFNDDGKITNSFGGYTDAARLVAKEMSVPLIDLQAMGAAFYESMGPDGSHRAFANLRENTHHNDYGSYEIAQCVLQGIRQNKLELAADIVDDFKGFDPSHPDPIENFKVPASTSNTDETPAGN